MTANHIAFHASERPQAIALIAQGNEISYGRLHRDLGKVTAALEMLGRPAGSSVAVCCADVYFHLLLLLGFEQLGITTASVDEIEGESAASFLASVDFVMSTGPRISTAKEFFPITAEWHRGIFDGDATADVPAPHGAAPVRILRTSGTTGLPKRLHFRHPTREAWFDLVHWIAPYDTRTRFLLTLPFTAEAGYIGVTLCLRAGSAVVAVPPNQTGLMPALITRYGITDAFILPGQLIQLLDELPVDFAKPPSLALLTFGGALGDELRERAMARVATRISDVYGTNEVGVVSLRRTGAPDGAGVVVPNVLIEVVDDADEPLPDGQAGRIRLKSPCLFEGYLDDPETNAGMLRDGWFYPGDVGILAAGRRLKILGRGDELLNIGGVKFGPHRIEDRVRAAVRLKDVGACSIPNRAGLGEVYLGVVGDAGVEAAVLAAAGTLGLGVFYVAKLDAIPRNANGKIKRKELVRAIMAEATRHDPSWPTRVKLDPA